MDTAIAPPKKTKLRPVIKYAALALIACSLFFGSNILYVWINTESTDNAYVEADISIVSPEVSGVITEILVQENTLVKKDQIIARIKKHDFISHAQKAEAMLEQAESKINIIDQDIVLAMIDQLNAKEDLDFAKTNHTLTEVNYNRVTKLNLDNFVSQKARDDTEIAFEKAKTALSQAELMIQKTDEHLILLDEKRKSALSDLKAIREEKAIADRALEHTDLKSPISGIFSNSGVKVGNYARAGVSLFSVVPMDGLYIKANYKETQVAKFKPGMQVHVTFDSLKDFSVIGTIRNISPATGSKFSLIPPQNATGNFTKIVQRVPVTIDFKIPEALQDKVIIVPGMSVVTKVRIDR